MRKWKQRAANSRTDMRNINLSEKPQIGWNGFIRLGGLDVIATGSKPLAGWLRTSLNRSQAVEIMESHLEAGEGCTGIASHPGGGFFFLLSLADETRG